jgi:hypothetical protein
MTATETTTALQRGNGVPVTPDAERRLRALERYAEGVVTLAAGEAEGTVTGLALSFTPTKVTGLSMTIPEGGFSIGVVAVGEPTADGFAWRLLNGVPDNDNYFFTWTLK